LTADQKQQHVNVCKELHQITSNDATILSRVITGDKSWIYSYDPETKQQSSQWKRSNSPRPNKARQVKRKVKSMLIIFFHAKGKGIFHKQFVLSGQTVNSAYYCDVLRQLCENVQRICPKLWQQRNWLLHDDNTPSHTSFFTREFFAKNKMTVVSQLKIKLKGHRFDTIEVIEAESQAVPNTLTEHDFQDALKKWQKHWEQCIHAEEGYFEGDGGQ
jgi:histone-lysine N-methyltransferase SETMAR